MTSARKYIEKDAARAPLPAGEGREEPSKLRETVASSRACATATGAPPRRSSRTPRFRQPCRAGGSLASSDRFLTDKAIDLVDEAACVSAA